MCCVYLHGVSCYVSIGFNFGVTNGSQTSRFPPIEAYQPTHARPNRRLSRPPNMLISFEQYQMAMNSPEDWSSFAHRPHDPLHLKARNHRPPRNHTRLPHVLTLVPHRTPLLNLNPSHRHRNTRQRHHILIPRNDSSHRLQTRLVLREQQPPPVRPENATFTRPLVRTRKSTMMFGGWSLRRTISGDSLSHGSLR